MRTMRSCRPIAVITRSLLVRGKSRDRRSATMAIALFACSRSTPGFRRAIPPTHCAPRASLLISRGLKISGRQYSAPAGTFRSAGATPTIVNALPSIRIVDPTMSGRPPNWRRHRPSPITTTRCRRFRRRRRRARGRAAARPEDVEEWRGDVGAVDQLRIAGAGEVRRARCDRRGAREDAALRRDVDEVRRRVGHRQASVAAVEQLDEAARLPVGQRPQQHAVDDGEDRRIRADAERQRQRGDGREAGLTAEHARGVPDVLYKRAHWTTPSR